MNKESISIRTVDDHNLAFELAIHEASHFVFNCLGLINLEQFTSNEYMSICLEKFDSDFNAVMGFLPDVPKSTMYAKNYNTHPDGYQKFYKDDRRRILAKLLALAAGYASYQVFIEPQDYFISNDIKERERNGNDKRLFDVEYYHINTDKIKECSDFYEIAIMLKDYYGLDNYQERLKVISETVAYVQNIMKRIEISESIKVVANILLENQCRKIEGIKIRCLEKEICTKLKNVSYLGILEKFKMKVVDQIKDHSTW